MKCPFFHKFEILKFFIQKIGRLILTRVVAIGVDAEREGEKEEETGDADEKRRGERREKRREKREEM